MNNSKVDVLGEFRMISFSELSLSIEHEKLLKRICSLNSSQKCQIPQTVGGLLDLVPKEFAKIPTVGASYVSSLISLKEKLFNNDTEILIGNKNVASLNYIKAQTPSFSLIPHSLDDIYLNYQSLRKQDEKLIVKLTKFYGKINIEDILGLDIDELKAEKGIAFGVLFLTSLKELQGSIRTEIVHILENKDEPLIGKSNLLVSSEMKFYELSIIDEILVEDIENYLWSLDDKKQDIALYRWGFNQDNETLEEVGERHGLTRERVRQLEKQINTSLPLHFRLHPKVLWANIRENMGEDLTVSLPYLAQCFGTEKLFYSFIELCCQVKRGSLIDITLPKVQRRLLEPFFCLNHSPVVHDVIVEELTSEFGYSRALAKITIRKLAELGSIKITDKGIKPQNMGNKEAVAHALTFHPEGLPWKDIARIINKKNYAKNINEERLTHGFNDSDYIYLSSHGNYRNLMFVDLEVVDFKSIMQHILEYFKSHNIEALNLHDYYQQTANERPAIEYFTLRHIVRNYGEEFGVYFNGKSGVDNVSINEVSERVTQWDVVVQALNQAKGAMTKQEIAERLRSKSLGHAGYYLNELMEKNEVIRIDKMMYSTPEKAFQGIELEQILFLIKKLMRATNKMVEADIFRQYVNRELNLSYSKYFYSALVAVNLGELGWYKKNNIISNTPIEYKNLLHVYKTVCLEALSNTENLKNVRKILWISDSVASNVLHQWLWQLKSQ